MNFSLCPVCSKPADTNVGELSATKSGNISLWNAPNASLNRGICNGSW